MTLNEESTNYGLTNRALRLETCLYRAWHHLKLKMEIEIEISITGFYMCRMFVLNISGLVQFE